MSFLGTEANIYGFFNSKLSFFFILVYSQLRQ